MYTNPYADKNVEKRYGEEVMSVSAKEFETYNGHISDELKGTSGKSCHVFNTMAKFNYLCYINDWQYLEEIGLNEMYHKQMVERTALSSYKLLFQRFGPTSNDRAQCALERYGGLGEEKSSTQAMEICTRLYTHINLERRDYKIKVKCKQFYILCSSLEEMMCRNLACQ